MHTVLQVRLHPDLIALKNRLAAEPGRHHDVCLTYVTARGRWYDVSSKGHDDRSGGIVTNIGIHFFDLLIWLFGPVASREVHLREARRLAGHLELAHGSVRWFLSTERGDLPFTPEPGVKTTFRSITVDGHEVEFSEGFTDLHTRVYEEVLAGRREPAGHRAVESHSRNARRCDAVAAASHGRCRVVKGFVLPLTYSFVLCVPQWHTGQPGDGEGFSRKLSLAARAGRQSLCSKAQA